MESDEAGADADEAVTYPSRSTSGQSASAARCQPETHPMVLSLRNEVYWDCKRTYHLVPCTSSVYGYLDNDAK